MPKQPPKYVRIGASSGRKESDAKQHQQQLCSRTDKTKRRHDDDDEEEEGWTTTSSGSTWCGFHCTRILRLLLLRNRFIGSGLILSLTTIFLRSSGQRLNGLENRSLSQSSFTWGAGGRRGDRRATFLRGGNNTPTTTSSLWWRKKTPLVIDWLSSLVSSHVDDLEGETEEEIPIYKEVVYNDFPHPFQNQLNTSNNGTSRILDWDWGDNSDLNNSNNDHFVSWKLQDPLLGQHRPNVDAIFAFVRGYSLEIVMRFVGSLLATGYTGDVVLGIEPAIIISQPQLYEYLKYHSQHDHLVAYEIELKSTDGKYPMHQVVDMFYYNENDTNTTNITSKVNETKPNRISMEDPRNPRSIEMIRFEYYWAWSKLYHTMMLQTMRDHHHHQQQQQHKKKKKRWGTRTTTTESTSSGSGISPRPPRIMVSDSRDVWFQRNPFPLLPPPFNNNDDDDHHHHNNSNQTTIAKTTNNTTAATSMAMIPNTLMVFEESSMVPIGQQGTNIWWMSKAYNRKEALRVAQSQTNKDRAVLCSGITIGGTAALQTYTAAMISQWDRTQCNVGGCDQGYHNYLLYSPLLTAGKDNIDRILVGRQGDSVVNTVGLLHFYGGRVDRTFRNRFRIIDNTTNEFLNHVDGSVSPVVHQYDRDGEIRDLLHGPKTELLQTQWQETLQKQQQQQQ